MEETVHIGVLSMHFHIPASQSLKSKRRVLKSLKDRIRAGFNVSVSEIGDHDKWQSAVFGACMIGNDKRHIERSLEAVLGLAAREGEMNLTLHEILFV